MSRKIGKIATILLMASDIDRKNIPLTRDAIENASQQDRLLYGEVVAQLRRDKGLTQDALAERSGVTSRTIRNIESGERAGQADKLIALLVALDVDLNGTLWSADVQRYSAMITPLIQAIHPDHRLNAIGQVMPLLARAVREHPNADVGGVEHPGDLPTIADHRERRLRSTGAKAAKRGKNHADVPHAD